MEIVKMCPYAAHSNMMTIVSRRKFMGIPCKVSKSLKGIGNFMEWFESMDTEGRTMVTLTNFTKEDINFIPDKYLPIFNNRVPRHIIANYKDRYVSCPTILGKRTYLGSFTNPRSAIIHTLSFKCNYCSGIKDLDFLTDYFNNIIPIINNTYPWSLKRRIKEIKCNYHKYTK